jgi:hypothetical protein
VTQPLPRRHSRLWLPALGERVLDQPWRFGPAGEASRLRVWQAPEGGFFAVVTETGTHRGTAELAVAEDTWRRLSERYGDPFGMAELWPAGEVDLVLPPRDDRLSRVQVWPRRPGHSLLGVLGLWWAVNGDVILAS